MPRITTWVRYWAWTFLFVLFGLAGLKTGSDAGWVTVSVPGLVQGVAPGAVTYGNVLAVSVVMATLLVWLFRREVKRHVQAAKGSGDSSGKMSLRRLVRYTAVTTVVAFLGMAGLKYFEVISGVWPAELVPLSYTAIGVVAAGLGIVAFLLGFWRYR